jgi:glycosyltransferase involved in cell wall biosynthesis
LEVGARWREQVDIEVLAPTSAKMLVNSFLGDVRIHPLGRTGARVKAKGPALAVEYVRRALEASVRVPPTDVAVAASYFIPDAAAIAAATRRGAHGVAYVYHLVETRRDRSPRTLWTKADERVSLALIRRCAGTIFTSNTETAVTLEQRGIRSTHTDVGLDLSSFRAGDPASAPPVALFVSRLDPTKGLVDVVESWSSVVRTVPEARLVVAGSGPTRLPAERRARELGIADLISWKGFVSEVEKRELLATSRLLVAPSHEEGWGISVAEALASGLPVVAYRLPTLDEIFGDGYFPVPVGDTRALAEAIVRIIRDNGLAASLSGAGRQAVLPYDLDRIAAAELKTILAARRRVSQPAAEARRMRPTAP